MTQCSKREEIASIDFNGGRITGIYIIFMSQILKIEYLCSRIDNMHVNGDEVMLKIAFVCIFSQCFISLRANLYPVPTTGFSYHYHQECVSVSIYICP